MLRRTKDELVAVIILALVAVFAAWYATYPRRRYAKVATLVGIEVHPPPPPSEECGSCPAGTTCVGRVCSEVPPVVAFRFSEPLPKALAVDQSALLKSFNSNDPLAPQVVAALTANGGVPFIPVFSPLRTEVVTNSAPAAIYGVVPPGGVTLSGSGVMWFAE